MSTSFSGRPITKCIHTCRRQDQGLAKYQPIDRWLVIWRADPWPFQNLSATRRWRTFFGCIDSLALHDATFSPLMESLQSRGVILKKYEKPTLVKREKLSSVVAVVISGPGKQPA